MSDFCKGKFKSGDWKRPPWEERGILKPIENHYAHVIFQHDEPLISYFATEKHLQTKIDICQKPGRYLKQFYSLDNEAIKKCVAMLENNIELCYATTPDEIEYVYTHGPRSCMSSPAQYYQQSNGIHPVRVYGNSDVKVAYLKRKDHIIARTLIWPEKKRHSRIYGDYLRLKPKLEEMGYIEKSLNGAKLRLIKTKNRIVCPYIDGISNVKVAKTGKHLLICGSSAKNKVRARETSGLASGYLCADCNQATSTASSITGSTLCKECNDKKTYICTHSRNRFVNDTRIEIINDEGHKRFVHKKFAKHYKPYRGKLLTDAAIARLKVDKQFEETIFRVT